MKKSLCSLTLASGLLLSSIAHAGYEDHCIQMFLSCLGGGLAVKSVQSGNGLGLSVAVGVVNGAVVYNVLQAKAARDDIIEAQKQKDKFFEDWARQRRRYTLTSAALNAASFGTCAALAAYFDKA